MIYTKKEDKQQIKKSLNMLFVEFDTNLLSFCEDYKYSYPAIYQKLTVNNISHDLVNEMICKLDKKRSLQRMNGKLVISKNF